MTIQCLYDQRAMLRAFAMSCLAVLLSALSACTPEPSGNLTPPQWVKQHQPKPDVAVVFVHGIFGDTLETWSLEGRPSFFDLMDKNPKVGGKFDMFAFGYPSKMFEGGSFDIQDAANTLYARLKYHGVLDYPALVFVAHSMGGLVVLRALLTERSLLERVPLLVFYATPQEGSQITLIADKVANNPALVQMLPADMNGSLRSLDSEWKSLKKRPPVRCAYEKRKTHGIDIVPWSSATRFCDGATIGVDEDHTGIVKPDGPDHDSVMLLANELDEYVTSKRWTPKLELPDFAATAEGSTFVLDNPLGTQSARVVNSGGGELLVELASFPSSGLYVIPGKGPTSIKADAPLKLEFLLGLNATHDEYKFVIKSNSEKDRAVLVRVPSLKDVLEARSQVYDRALSKVQDVMRDEFADLKALPATDPKPQKRVITAVSDAIDVQIPELSKGARLLLTAELLDQANWHELAKTALDHAVQEQPSLGSVPSVERFKVRIKTLSEPRSSETPATPALPGNAPNPATPFTGTAVRSRAAALATQMEQVPALRGAGASLRGDLEATGNHPERAAAAYRGVVTRSAALRQNQVRGTVEQ